VPPDPPSPAPTSPAHVEALIDLGNRLCAAGRADAGLANYKAALVTAPYSFEALVGSAQALRRLGRPREALADYDAALALRPGASALHTSRGAIYMALGEWSNAVVAFEQAIAGGLEHAEMQVSRAMALLRARRFPEALSAAEQAATRKPDWAPALVTRGSVLIELQRPLDALASLTAATALAPQDAAAHLWLGRALHALGRPSEALSSFNRAIELNQAMAEGYINRGAALDDLNEWNASLADYDHALTLNAALPELHLNRGNVLRNLNRVEEALASYERALALQPDSPHGHFNRALTQLVMGNFAAGLPGLESRSRLGHGAVVDAPGARLWLGNEPIAGKTLALIGEWGAGDILQFCRYSAAALQLGAHVIVIVPRSLVRLLSSLSGAGRVMSLDDPLPEFEFYCPMLSLPLAFNTNLDSIPAHVPYLHVTPELRERWRARLGQRRRTRVGLVWSGGFRQRETQLWAVNTRRNIPLAQLAPLSGADVDFYSLQKGEPAESELAGQIKAGTERPPLIDLTSELRDYADTAALVDQLDLVVTVDTSVAHLTGALGKPVWILNRFDTCWRWLLDRQDSPWYPTARLYRQEVPGDWDAPIACVARDLRRFAEERAADRASAPG
jgi:tetratricopeptide (TPR) repeat protein